MAALPARAFTPGLKAGALARIPVASVGVTTPSGASPEDAFWRRPAPDQPPTEPTGQPTDPTGGVHGSGQVTPGYAGPPPTVPPPPGWRPPVHLRMPPPRQLPPQDMTTIDNAEQQAQRLTYGVGVVAATVLVILTCLLCARVIF